MLLLIILLLCIYDCHAAKQVNTISTPLCPPQSSDTGGMFGYSIATVTRNSSTWLAIGEPWTSKVFIYTTPHTDVNVSLVNVTTTLVTCINNKTSYTTSYILNTDTTTTTSTTQQTTTTDPTPTSSDNDLLCTTTTNTKEKVQFSYNITANPISWTLVQTLTDDLERESTGNAIWNGTRSAAAKSLFGYDLAISADGHWLAVGTPGRTLIPYSQFGVRSLAWHPYHGSVMMYQLGGGSSQQQQQLFSFHSQLLIAQLSLTPQYFDRFGSKLHFSLDTVQNRMFLFVGSNGGYDGVSKPGGLAGNGMPPVFGQSSWPSLPTSSTSNLGVGVFKYTSTSNTWTGIQFLTADTPIPLGTLGIDFDVGGTGALDTVLVMRGYTGTGTGMVVIYRQDIDRYVQVQKLVADQQDHLFGVGINIQVIPNQMAVLHIGSPRQNIVLRYICKQIGIYDEWVLDGSRSNPVTVNVAGHHFFGGTLASNAQGLVFASDAAGASGRGHVYMYHRRGLGRAVFGFEDVLRELPTTTTSTDSSSDYDYIGILNIPVASNNNQMDGIYSADQFGKAVSVSGNLVVVGAPVNGCVYTFPAPVSYPIPNWFNSVELPDNPITQSPTPTFPPGERVSSNQTIMYAIIGSVAGVLVFGTHIRMHRMTEYLIFDLYLSFCTQFLVPLAIYSAMRYHKYKLLNQLQAQAQANSPTSQMALTTGL